MKWKFDIVSRCDAFYVQICHSEKGDTMDMPVPEYDLHPNVANAVTRRNYATCVRGSVKFIPPNDPPFVVDTPGGKWPWAGGPGGDAAPCGDWVWETLEDNTLYVCCTAVIYHRLDYEECFGGADPTVHVLKAETWAVPFVGQAVINGEVVPEFEIAHQGSGEMRIESPGLVVCITERPDA